MDNYILTVHGIRVRFSRHSKKRANSSANSSSNEPCDEDAEPDSVTGLWPCTPKCGTDAVKDSTGNWITKVGQPCTYTSATPAPAPNTAAKANQTTRSTTIADILLD